MAEIRASYQAAEEMPAELATALLQWLLALADSKHTLGLQFSHWVTGTPALEAAVGSAAIAQDELGHARSLHALLRHYPGAPDGVGAENDLEARATYFVPAALLPRWESWYQVVAANVVLDRALALAVGAMADSAFTPLAGRVAKILQEEGFHRIFGDNWLARLGQRDEQVRAGLQRQINWAWDVADQWLGPDQDPIVTTLQECGILTQGVPALRSAWLAVVAPLLAANGFAVPELASEWTHWNPQFRHNDHA